MRQLIAGNWKMKGLRSALADIGKLARELGDESAHADVLICPPATLIADAARAAEGHFAIGGQDCHVEAQGAHTGDISAEMLRDAGAVAVIVGHSERRTQHGESDVLVAAKAMAAKRAGLMPIICVGESEAARDAGKAVAVVVSQLAGSVPPDLSGNFAIAYEPVWAIGTGRTPTPAQIAEMHASVRAALSTRLAGGQRAAIRILYGGSVKAANAAEILALENVDGALVGGASLKVQEFLAIIRAAAKR